MNRAQKRLALYGAAAVILGGVGVAMAVVETRADAMTLLSSADVQLRLAYGMPAVDKRGLPLTERQRMIDEAVSYLEMVEEQAPGMAITSEFRGFAHMMSGEYADAATCYSRARRCGDCGDEQGDVLAFNEARMLWQAGDAEAALRVFAARAAALDSRFGHQRRIEQAQILAHVGRRDEAFADLAVVVADDAAGPMAWMQAGVEFARLGADERAESAYRSALAAVPVANYHLGLLKLRQGAVDTAMECLERSFAGAPADTRRLVQQESDAWQAAADDERFERLTGSAAATPGR